MSPDREGETSMRECSTCGETCDVAVSAPTGVPIECSDCELLRVGDEGCS